MEKMEYKISLKKPNLKYIPAVFATMAIVALMLLTATNALAYCPPENQKCQLAPPSLADDASIQNDYLSISVSDSDSTFTLGNTGGDPANPNDDNQILLYGHPYPWSSFTTVRVDGSDYIFGSSDGTFTQVPTSYPTYIKSVWVSHNIQVTQTLQFATNPATGRVDVMQIRYMLENLDLTNSHNVGLRVLLDTMLGGNDGAPFYIPGTGAVTTEHEYTGASIPDYWVAFDDLGNPTVVSQGTFRGSDATVPDRVIFVSWPDFYSTEWDYTITPGKIFGSTSYPDSSVGVYWNTKTLGPGQRIEYVTYYGLSSLSQSLMPPLTLSVTGPLNLDVVNGAYNPNPFTVTAYVQDVSTNVINDVSISIGLPAGLSLEPGSPATQTISTLNPNEIRSVSWSVRAADQANEQLFSYDITATASGISERKVTRSLLVPALALTYDTTFRSNPNGYQFNNFGIPDINSWDFFRNTFGADEVEINGQHRPRATNFYNNNFRYYASGGSCFGMASSSSILFQNSHDGWDLGLNRNGPLPSPNWPVFPTFIQTPTDWVEYYQLRWSDAAIQADRQINPTPNDAYNLLKQRMAGGNWIQNPLVLTMWWGNNAGHSVVPYRIEESADHQQANVRIYDNNYPGQERTVQFNLNANTVRDADYNGGNNLGAISNPPVEMHSLSAIQSEPQMADYDTVTPSAHLLYTDSEGKRLGYINGEFKNEIDGAYLLNVPWQNENQNILETYYTANLDLKRELHGLIDGVAKVSVSRPNSLVTADVQVASDSADELRVPVDDSSVEFISGKGTSSLGLTLDRETAEFARVAHVDGFGVESGSAVQQLFSEDLNKAGLINKGAKKNYNLYLEQIGLNPGKYTHPVPVAVEANSANWLTPYNWDDLARTYVQLDEDFGNDGTIDNTEILTELQATIDIDPDTINLGSKGKYITAYIQLPVGYDVNSIDIASIQIVIVQGNKLDMPIGTVGPHEIGDHNNDGISDLMVKFDRKSLTDILKEGSAEIELIGELDGTYFSGTDTVKVLKK
jgi:hypothetical protein